MIRRSQTTEGGTHIVTMGIAGDRPPRYGLPGRRPVTVGLGPVPRHRPRAPTFAGDRPPRDGLQGRFPVTVGLGPVPRHRSRAPTFAGDRPPRDGLQGRLPCPRRARACPSPCVWLSDRVTPVVQDRLILTCSGSGDPELQLKKYIGLTQNGGMMTFASGPNTFDNLTDFVVSSQQLF